MANGRYMKALAVVIPEETQAVIPAEMIMQRTKT
jgi:hypothetical protein